MTRPPILSLRSFPSIPFRRMGFRREGGFTLIEILAAFLVLSLGMGAILGFLSSTLARERAAVMRTRIAGALPVVEELVGERVREEGKLRDVVDQEIPGFPSLRWSASFREIPDWPGEVLAWIVLTWQEGGDARKESVVEFFSRLEPFHVRAARVLLRRGEGAGGGGG